MNLTVHAFGSVLLGEARAAQPRSLSIDLATLSPEDGAREGSIILNIRDSVAAGFCLKLKLTAMQAAQLGYQLSDLAQDAQHGMMQDAPRVILSRPPVV